MRSPLVLTLGAISLCLQLAGQTARSAPQNRFTEAVDETDRVTARGNVHPLARTGDVAQIGGAAVPMQQMILDLSPSSEQESELQQLIQRQQEPKSPLYHHFLSPQEFAARFGVSESDIAKVASWLKSHGFTIDEIPAGARAPTLQTRLLFP